MIARARDSDPQGILDEMFPLLVHPSRAGDVTLRKIVQDMGDDIGAEGFINNQTAIIARADSRPTMATIKCPTLVLTGDQDQLIPNSLSKEMAEGIPGARLIVTPDCGHCPQLERPLATADALVEWLRI
jgi:pimeloyl-ACP methyl ester carboxylesterase